MRTVSFLNKFAETCETRLMEFDNKIENIEASLLILESQVSLKLILFIDGKLELDSNVLFSNSCFVHNTPLQLMSVPWLNKKTDDDQTKSIEKDETLNLPDVDNNDTDSPDSKGVKAHEDPRYSKFFKMVQVGVPAEAVKLKMESEGYDSNILE